MVTCNQPHPAARVFADVVNSYCTIGHDIDACGKCMENFGILAEYPEWDINDPRNRIWCKCTTNFMQHGREWVQNAGLGVQIVAGFMGLLVICELYLLFCVPTNLALLHQKVQTGVGRIMRAPKHVHNHAKRIVGAEVVQDDQQQHHHHHQRRSHKGDRQHEVQMMTYD